MIRRCEYSYRIKPDRYLNMENKSKKKIYQGGTVIISSYFNRTVYKKCGSSIFNFGIYFFMFAITALIIGCASTSQMRDIKKAGFSIQKVKTAGIADESICDNARILAKGRKFNQPYCFYGDQSGRIYALPPVEAAINKATGRYEFVPNDMLINCGELPVFIGAIVLKKGDIIVMQNNWQFGYLK